MNAGPNSAFQCLYQLAFAGLEGNHPRLSLRELPYREVVPQCRWFVGVGTDAVSTLYYFSARCPPHEEWHLLRSQLSSINLSLSFCKQPNRLTNDCWHSNFITREGSDEEDPHARMKEEQLRKEEEKLREIELKVERELKEKQQELWAKEQQLQSLEAQQA